MVWTSTSCRQRYSTDDHPPGCVRNLKQLPSQSMTSQAAFFFAMRHILWMLVSDRLPKFNNVMSDDIKWILVFTGFSFKCLLINQGCVGRAETTGREEGAALPLFKMLMKGRTEKGSWFMECPSGYLPCMAMGSLEVRSRGELAVKIIWYRPGAVARA